MSKLKPYVISLRKFRVWHRYTGLILLTLLIISSITGVLLAWKKNSDTLQPPTQKGVSTDLTTWKPLYELADIAQKALVAQDASQKDNKIDRMDARPKKGIVKVLFKKGYWEVQVDGTNGTVKSVAKRHADWIEHLHDGSIVNDLFKLISMNFLGFGLFFLMGTGFWLWYGPKKIKQIKKERLLIKERNRKLN